MQTRHRFLAVTSAFAIAAAAGLVSGAARAQRADPGSPFTVMEGTWAGNGAVTFSDNSRERIRCRANYKPEASGANMTLDLRCASDSYKFELRSNVSYADGKVSGNWSEATRNAAGQLIGSGSGNKVDLRAEGQTFAALLSMVTRGDRQVVSIRSPGSTMSEVAITLNKI